MRKLEFQEMENINGGECYKTATKVLVGAAGVTIGVLTGGLGALAFAAWGMYELADTMTSGCEEF